MSEDDDKTTCERCGSWYGEGESFPGECRKCPPTVFWDDKTKDWITLYPETWSYEWCGMATLRAGASAV